MLQVLIHFLLFLASAAMHILYTPFWIYYQCKGKKKCPPVYEQAYFYTAEILAAKIRSRELTSSYIVSLYINRVKEVNPILNAIVENRFKLAVEEAEHVDDFIENTQLSQDKLKDTYPLLGVPLTIKESISVAGMSNNAGMFNSGRDTSNKDAVVVKQLKSAGAIVILVSNTPEMCYNWETYNVVTGRTLNPYDTRRTCGGSSGGEAVLLASCGSIIGIGSDLVGSLRLPPAFCGVYGHRPTSSLVSIDGHFPKTYDNSETFMAVALVFGPLTRYASDLPIMLDVMMKPEMKGFINIKDEVNAKLIKVYYIEGIDCSLTSKMDNEVILGIRKIIRHLSIEGFFTKKVNIERMSDIIDISFIPLLTIDNMAGVFADPKKSIYAEIAKTMICRSKVTPNAIFYVWLKAIFKCLASEKCIENHMKLLQELKSELLEILGDDGILICPTFPTVAHFHGQIYSRTLDSSYMAIFSNMGLPVTVCPIGLNSQGLPMSIQVISKDFNDGLCFAIARELERSFGGWVPPPFTRTQNI